MNSGNQACCATGSGRFDRDWRLSQRGSVGAQGHGSPAVSVDVRMSEPLTEPPPADVRFELLVSSSGKSRAVALPVGRAASVGRGDENLIRLDYPSVSRVHVQLHPGVEGVEVEDLGSSNGTMLIRG